MEKIYLEQKKFFQKGETKAKSFRIKQLKILRDEIKEKEQIILDALKKDLGKNHTEAYTSEIYPLLSEIKYHIENISKWLKKEKVSIPLIFQPAKAHHNYTPKGVVLIIGPFNYPFLLTLRPLIGAISAGNCTTIKTSEKTKNISKIIIEIVAKCFDKKFVHACSGDPQFSKELAQLPFDHYFFTGSTRSGKEVYKQAAENLSTVTLELGGRSPFIVWSPTNVQSAAKKCVWGKCMNHGQTCVAPNHVLIEEKLLEEFIHYFKIYVKKSLGSDFKKSKFYSSCINQDELERLKQYLVGTDIICGGEIDNASQRMEPTLVKNIKEDHPLYENEIFGPILPIYTFKKTEDMIYFCTKNKNPLTTYIFSDNKTIADFFSENYQTGSVIFYETMIQAALPRLPFGGVGSSGIGRCQGFESFKSFSNIKSIYKGSKSIDSNVRYSPYMFSLPWIKRLTNFMG